MNLTPDIDKLKPYDEKEIKFAIQRIAADPTFLEVTDFLFPEMPKEKLLAKINNISTTYELQKQFMHHILRTIIKNSTNGLSFDGLENINQEQGYLYISNHRDIFLDSSLLGTILFENDFDTTYITFGSNLLYTQFVTDVAKINKIITVVRDARSKEFYFNSKLLSIYLRNLIADNKDSVWIAQRNGRTKDGYDKTQTGVLKMLNVSGNSNFVENFKNLNIIPVSISYEYEPCDALKVRELYLSKTSTYKKSKDEDFKSILIGITEPKGRIHLSIGKPVTSELGELESIKNDNEKFKKLSSIIDNQIYNAYKLWPTNYIAADLLTNDMQYSENYTAEEKELFTNHMDKKLGGLQGDSETLQKMFLELYANPVKNCFKV